MKNLICLFILFVFNNCKSSKFSSLNRKINKSQLKSIKESPFKTAKGMKDNLTSNLVFREKYLNVIEEMRTNNMKEPIIIEESYDIACKNCPADYIRLYNNDEFLLYRLDNYNNKTLEEIKYTLIERDTIFKGSRFDDFKTISQKINLKEKWNLNPLDYGIEYGVSDGSLSIYTVVYPNNKIESMFMRLWTKEFKN